MKRILAILSFLVLAFSFLSLPTFADSKAKVSIVLENSDGDRIKNTKVKVSKTEKKTNSKGVAKFSLTEGKEYKISVKSNNYTFETVKFTAENDLKLTLTGKSTKTIAKAITKSENPENSVVRVFLAYEMSDGSYDVFASGSGVYIGQDRILTAYENVSFTGAEDTKYLKAISSRVDNYATLLGVDLTNYDEIKESLKVIVALPDGTYEVTSISASDSDLSYAILNYAGHDDNVEPLSLSEILPDGESKIIGYSAEQLEKSAEYLIAGDEVIDEAKPKTKKYEITSTSTSLEAESLDRGFVGGAVISDNKLLGLLTATSSGIGEGLTGSAVITALDGQEVNVEAVIAEGESDEITISDSDAYNSLSNAVQEAESVQMGKFSAKSVKSFLSALEASKTALEDTTLSDDEYNLCLEELQAAAQDLETKAWYTNPIYLIGLVVILVCVILAFIFVFNLKSKSKDKNKSEKAPKKNKKVANLATHSTSKSEIDDEIAEIEAENDEDEEEY